MYSIDTNIFLDWWERWYPHDVFPSLRKKIESQASKIIFSPVGVYDEIQKIASSTLKIWAKNNAGIFVPHDPRIQKEAAQIVAKYPSLVDPNATYTDADPFVIALAKCNNGTVVTSETSFASKRKPLKPYYIPDVCNALGIPCLGFLDMMRAEKWAF